MQVERKIRHPHVIDGHELVMGGRRRTVLVYCSPKAGCCANGPIAFHAEKIPEEDILHVKSPSTYYLEVKVRNPCVMYALFSLDYAFVVSAQVKATALGDDHPQSVGPEKAPSYESEELAHTRRVGHPASVLIH